MNDSYNNYDDKNLSEKKPCFILPTSLNSELKATAQYMYNEYKQEKKK